MISSVVPHEWEVCLGRCIVGVLDGQPVRWALNLAIPSGLRDRVYGPSLMLQVGGLAAKKDVPIYLFGSMVGVLQRLTDNLVTRFPSLRIGRNGCPEDVALISR